MIVADDEQAQQSQEQQDGQSGQGPGEHAVPVCTDRRVVRDLLRAGHGEQVR